MRGEETEGKKIEAHRGIDCSVTRIKIVQFMTVVLSVEVKHYVVLYFLLSHTDPLLVPSVPCPTLHYTPSFGMRNFVLIASMIFN